MSSPRYDWWPYVKRMIRKYPALKTQKLHGVSLCEFEAVQAAIEETERMKEGGDRLKIVDMVL